MNDTFTYFQKKGCTVFSFPGKTRVLSTSPLNGGITAHLTHALNINCMNGAYECEMLGNTYEEDLNIHTKELGIDPQTATALSTAAWTELCAVEKICYQELSVTAAVTGGIDSNGMCPGDPSSYYERNGAYEMLPPGTINVFIYINQNVTEAAMVRSMMIASEAKAAAVSHLLLGSCYSEEIATGSGTDGMVIASAMEGELTLTDASGHSKLGELIGRAVRMAVKHALMKQTAACGPRQFQVLVRTGRYGITPGTLWDFYTEHEILFHAYNISFKKASELEGILLSRNRNSNLVLCVSLYLHLMDQLRWGLIMEPEAVREGKRLLLYGLYCGRDTYLGDVYPEDVWKNEVLKTFSLKEQLIYILICYFSVRSLLDHHIFMVKIFYACFLLMKYKREVNRISSMSTHFPPEIVEIYIHIIREKPQKSESGWLWIK